MKYIELEKLFEINSGNDLDLNKLQLCKNGINYVSRNRNNNGVVASVAMIDGQIPNEAGTISVALSSSSTLFAFLQDKPYYTGYHVAVLKARTNMTKNVKLFYCTCLIANRYKYNWGRQANKSINKLKVPDISEIPDWVESVKIKDLTYLSNKQFEKNMNFFNHSELYFKLISNEQEKGLFTSVRGSMYQNSTELKKEFKVITSSSENNGTSKEKRMSKKFHSKNVISLSANGESCDAFYQNEEFIATDDVHVLYPNFKLNPYIALYLCTVIRCNKFKFNYARKLNNGRLDKLYIKLPVTKDNVPDFEYMEKCIKTLNFSYGIN